MDYKGYKLVWKKDYGDNEYTEDIVLWVVGKNNTQPLDISISGAICGWYGVLYVDNKQLAIADTRKELKDMLFKNFTKELDKELSYIDLE